MLNRVISTKKRDKIIKQYQEEKARIKNLNVKQALLDIEHNKFGAMNFKDPIYEAAETYLLWKEEGLI